MKNKEKFLDELNNLLKKYCSTIGEETKIYCAANVALNVFEDKICPNCKDKEKPDYFCNLCNGMGFIE